MVDRTWHADMMASENRPKIYQFVDQFSAPQEGVTLIKGLDAGPVDKLFRGLNYVVMGQNNNREW